MARWDVQQKYPAANTLVGLYSVPDGKRSVASTLLACNQSDVDTWFSVTVAPNGDADEEKHYLYHEALVRAKRTFAATIGLTLAARTVVRVKSGNGRVSFHLSRDEQEV